MSQRKPMPPLILERLLDGINLHILSVVEYKRKHFLCIVDDIKPTTVNAYVLDFAEQEGIDINTLMSLAIRWYYFFSDKFPISVMFAKEGLTHITQRIYRRFNKVNVGRIIGAPFAYNLHMQPKSKKRRVVRRKEVQTVNLQKILVFCSTSQCVK
jgi:hypothetical protein